MKNESEKLAELENLIASLKKEIADLKKAATIQNRPDTSLTASQKIIESFFDDTITPLVLLDKNYNFIRVNEAYARACQKNVSDFPGHNHFELYPSDAKEIFDKVVQTKESIQVIARPFSFPDRPEWGVTYWDWKLTPLLDRRGEVEFLVFSLEDVTKRQMAEIALAASEEKYRALFQQIEGGFALHEIIFDDNSKPVDYRFLEINSDFEKLTGLRKEDIIGKTVLEVIPNLDPFWIEQYGRVVLTGKPIRFEGYSAPLGKQYEARAFRSEPGKFAVVINDITEKKTVEKVITAERKRLYDVLETLPVYVILLTPDYHVSFANRFFRERFGESNGKRCYEYLFNRTEPCPNCETYKVFDKNGPHRWEWTGPDNRNYDIYDFPFIESDGTTHILEMGIDVTERKITERALRESEGKYRSLFSHMTSGFVLYEILHDADDKAFDARFLEVNSAYEQMLGVKKDDQIGKTVREIYPFVGLDRIKMYDEVARTGNPIRLESSNPVLGKFFDSYVYSPRPGQVAIMFVDITERKTTEEAQKDSEKRYHSLFTEMINSWALLAIIEDENGRPYDARYLDINPAFEGVAGFPRNEIVGHNISEIFPEFDASWYEACGRVARTGESFRMQQTIKRIDKTFITAIFCPAPGQFAVIREDITEKVKAQERANRLNRVYSVLSNINEAIVRVKDVNRLFEESCRIAVEEGKLRMAWIGLVDPESGMVKVAAFSGLNEGYLDSVSISSRDESSGRGPTGTCIRENRFVTCNDFATDPHMVPWRDEAAKRGYRASAAFPLHLGNKIIGAFTLYSEEAEFFKDDEIQLLKSLAEDISFAIQFLEMEKERRQVEAERDRLFNYSIDMLCIAGFDGFFKQLNPAWEKVLGWKTEELTSHPWIDFVHPDDVQETIRALDCLKDGIAVTHFENRYRRQDGTYCWISWNANPFLNESLIFCIARDVTFRKESEARLVEANAYNRRLIESSLDPLVTIGAEGKITDANAATELITGFTRDELIGTDFSDYFTEPERARAGYQQVFREGLVRDYELQLKHRDGHSTPVLYNASLYKDSKGNTIGIFAAARDITEHLKAEAEIHKLNAELEQRVIERTAQLEKAIKELEAFSYTVSHDLRAPLRAIDGFSKIILEDYQNKFDDEGKRVLSVIRHNTVFMGQLIDDLLEFSRLGKQKIVWSDIDMEELARQVGVEIKLAFPGQLPTFEIEAIPRARGDRILIHQVLANLLFNAVKFTSPKREGKVQFGGRPEANENIYFIKDNGVGFDIKYVDKLFGVFQRLHRKEEFEGTGVGLATVKRIIDMHGGRVWAEGQVDQGAIFYFSLPNNSLKEETAGDNR